MKHRIPILLVAILVFLMSLPLAIAADDEATDTPAQPAYTNTTELFDTSLDTVYATYGTPTIGTGNKDAWRNAYSFTVTTLYKQGNDYTNYPINSYIVFYVMWDENNLYILEDRPFDAIQYYATPGKDFNWANWKGGGIDMSNYRLVLPTDIDAENGKYGADNLIYIGTGVKDTDAAGTVADSIRQARVAKFDGSGEKHTKEDYEDLLGKFSGIQSKTTRTENGFFMETAIPWSAMDDFDKEAFVAAEGKTLGLGLNINMDDRSNRNTLPHGNENKDFQPLKLVRENPTAAYIEPDFSWFSEGQTEIVLEDEGDLMGFMLLTSYGTISTTLQAKYGACNWSIGRSNFFCANKTVKLAKDMDLNPGWKADGTGEKTFGNPWSPIAIYRSTFDGQGHTVRGIRTDFCMRYVNQTGFFSFIGPASTVKNLRLENGIVKSPDLKDDDLIGGLVGCVHGNKEASTITIENVWCDFTVVGARANSRIGGLIGGVASGENETTLILKNCTFAGKISSTSDQTVIGTIAGRIDQSPSVTTQYGNCKYDGGETELSLFGEVTGTLTELPPDETPPDDNPPDDNPPDDNPPDDNPSDDNPTDEKPTDEKPTDEKPTDEKPTDEKPTDEKPTDGKPADDTSVAGCASALGGSVLLLPLMGIALWACRKKEQER